MPTEIEIEATLSGLNGPVVIKPRFEFADQLGRAALDITDAVMECIITFNSDNQITREAQFKLNQEALGDEYAGARARVRLPNKWILVTQVVDVNGVEVEYQMGLFRLTPQSQATATENGKAEIDATGYDPAILLLATTDTPFTALALSKRTTVVTQILNQFGLTKVVIETDPNPGIFGYDDVGVDISWPAGTPWIEIINELLTSRGYWPLWFDGGGTAYARDAGAVETPLSTFLGSFTVDAVYTSDNGLLIPPVTFRVDNERQPNTINVFSANPLITSSIGVSVRNLNKPPNGIYITGRIIKEVIDSYGATFIGHLSQQGLRRITDASSMAVQLSIETVPDPRRNNIRALREIYQVRADDWMEAVDSEPARYFWHCIGWQYDVITPGAPMSHSLISLVPNALYDFEIIDE